MPEGPECRHIRDCLDRKIKEKKLQHVEIKSGRYLRHGPPQGWDLLNTLLQTKTLKIVQIGCRGKFLYWLFEDQSSLWITLGMSGQWTSELLDHCHVQFDFDNGETVYFRDVRNFGTLKYVPTIEQLNKKLTSLGYDILNSVSLDDTQCLQLFKKKQNMNICKFLMNQTYFSGVGNYIKSEALHMSQINPFATIKQLTDTQLIDLYQSIRTIASSSYQAKGASFLTFKDPDQNKGKYSFQFKVYGKTTFQDFTVQKAKTPDGRTSFWVPELTTI